MIGQTLPYHLNHSDKAKKHSLMVEFQITIREFLYVII